MSPAKSEVNYIFKRFQILISILNKTFKTVYREHLETIHKIKSNARSEDSN